MINKKGSINLPDVIRKALGLKTGSYMDLKILNDGEIRLRPVSVYPNILLNDKGLAKIKEARESNKGTLPEWLIKEIKKAQTSAK